MTKLCDHDITFFKFAFIHEEDNWVNDIIFNFVIDILLYILDIFKKYKKTKIAVNIL